MTQPKFEKNNECCDSSIEIPNFNRIKFVLSNIPPIQLEIDAVQALTIVSQIQLALRHPENQNDSSAIARSLAQQVGGLLSQFDPELAKLIEAGWNPERDLTREEFEAQTQLEEEKRSVEREILHHHAAAIDWLCEQLEARLGTDARDWRTTAFSHALDRWYAQTPDEMKEALVRNLDALKAVMNYSV